MRTKFFPLLTILLFSSILFAQENANTIENQFISVVDKSNNYQEFKVIKKTKIYALRKNILDSIAALENTINITNSEISQQKTQISTLQTELSTTKGNLVTSKEKEDGIELLGMLTKKSTYNIIMWSIIGGLIAILALLFYKFKSSHSVTKESLLKLSETESNFDSHRQKTLENEQLLRRKLQDEINKNRNV